MSEATPGRLQALDGLRGLIMAIMAIDHASAFVAAQHFSEFWGLPLPDYYGDPLSLLTRVVSHLCAPGFFFLMGVSMQLFAVSRRAKGMDESTLARHFVKRGVLLIVVELFITNPAFILGSLEQVIAGGAPFESVPGGDGLALPMGVLAALGAAMVAAAFALRLRAAAATALGIAILLGCQVALPTPEHVDHAYPVVARLLLIAGQTGYLFVLYPLLPWLGVTLLGMGFGHALATNPSRALRLAAPAGLALLAGFVAIRLSGGFGNSHLPVGPGWMALLTLTKYPPSLAFLSLALGVNGLLLAVLFRGEPLLHRLGAPLLVFGRAPLFFYVVHLYVYAVIGLVYPGETTLLGMYPFWLLGLVALYPLCVRYDRWKRSRSADSLWRLF